MAWAAFPVVDAARWPGVDLFVAFNDAFFMSLMFLISGVFAWASLERKGRARFVRERLGKLGPAFVVSAAVLAPLAYYPAFLSLPPQAMSFARQWLALGSWPAGPAWFLWVLLAFAATAALVHARVRAAYAPLGRLGERPILFFGTFLALTALAYLPLAAVVSPFHWASAGAFFVQTTRALLYAACFFVGIALGAYGREAGLLARDGRLARRWALWTAGALVAFGISVVVFVVAVLPTLSNGGPGPVARALGNFAFVLSCSASSFAFLAVFTRFARRPNPVADSLSANAFGIYLLHYAFVSWLQWLLLPAPLSGAAKGTLVFLGAVVTSWASSAILRRAFFSKRRAAVSPAYSPSGAA